MSEDVSESTHSVNVVSAFCVLRSAFCVLRSAFCVLRTRARASNLSALPKRPICTWHNLFEMGNMGEECWVGFECVCVCVCVCV